MRRFILIIAILLMCTMFFGCSSASKEQVSEQSDKLKIYTSIYPIYEFTRQVGGDKVQIINVVPAGSEPHEWEPTPKIVAEIVKADVLILSGTGVEPWAEKILKLIDPGKVTVVYAGHNIELIEGIGHHHEDKEPHDEKHHNHDHDHDTSMEKGQEQKGDSHRHEIDGKDPHVWLDPLNAKIMVDNILAGLIKVDEGNRDAYLSNAETFKKGLDLLHEEYQSALASVQLREFITSHAAFGYLAKRYGLIQIPIRGLSAESEPSPANMAAVTKLAKEKEIKYIFFETLISPKVSEAIAREIQGKTLVLNPLESLTDEEIASGKNYLSVMRDNLGNLKIALGAR